MKTKMVYGQNNGVIAAMFEFDFEAYERHKRFFDNANLAALQGGARWYTYISYERFLREPNLAKLVTGTYANWEELSSHVEKVEKSLYVPFSNGPLYWNEEKLFSAPLHNLSLRLRVLSTETAFMSRMRNVGS